MAQARWSGRRFLSPGAWRILTLYVVIEQVMPGLSLDKCGLGWGGRCLSRWRDDAWPWLVVVIVMAGIVVAGVGLGIA